MSERVAEAARKATLEPFTPKPVPTLNRLFLADGMKALFFGDSWTAGYAAAPSTEGYAYIAGRALALDFTVDTTGSGTGYLNPGPQNTGTYETRLNNLPDDPDLKLFVLQGGLNDQGQNLGFFVDVARRTIELVQRKFPNAQVVIMGPIPPSTTAGNDLLSIETNLAGLAQSKGLHYVSGLQKNWIKRENFEQVIDVSKASHPSTYGHKYLGDQLADELRSRAS